MKDKAEEKSVKIQWPEMNQHSIQVQRRAFQLTSPWVQICENHLRQ
jgi:hypothetical protein